LKKESRISRIKIPSQEYLERINKCSKLVADAGLDVLIANSNEVDCANVRYFSGFWPLFEVGGVAISANSQSSLLVGPESEEFAEGWSPLKNIQRMREYRESTDPAFPEGEFSNFNDVFDSIGVTNPKKIGIAGLLEVENPWMETTSHYPLEQNMTFQIDTFVRDKEFGLRWETGAVIKEGGIELLPDYVKEIVVL
jgi:Xaa-Pro aminopeptidase